MNTLRLTIVFLFGMFAAGFLLAIDAPRWLIFALLITFYLLIMVLPSLYVTYYSNNLKRIERFIHKNRRKAIFAFPYALAHGNDRDVEQAVEQILAVHKQPVVQQTYRTLLAILRNQFALAEQYADQIQRPALRNYYLAYSAALSGDFERAALLNDNVEEAWMKSAIDAVIAYESEHPDFALHSEKSINAARGVQKFVLSRSFGRMKNSML